MTKYPHVTVYLNASNGNAFSIIAKVNSALRKAGIEQSEIAAFNDEATSGDYDNLLSTAMNWVNVE